MDQLTGIIRKAAGAWSRSNLPPPHLDTMFRSIETVYKANRSLYSKLKEIGTNPSSPKALGDLLMRWIDDLDTPYTFYCTNYRTGFDTYPPVSTNAKLGPVLAAFSQSVPPPLSPSSPSFDETSGVWGLDALFALPAQRIRYYKKLYSRLLKSTAPGRSDYKLLVGAVEKLERLLGVLERRAGYVAGEEDPPDDDNQLSPPRPGRNGAGGEDEGRSRSRSRARGDDSVPPSPAVPAPPPKSIPPPPELGEDEVAVDMRLVNGKSVQLPPLPLTVEGDLMASVSGSVGNGRAEVNGSGGGYRGPGSDESNGESGSSGGVRSSNTTSATSVSRSSSTTMSMPISHLEKRCSMSRVLDIFTMKPKVVRLQITPPQLTFTRELRFSTDVRITITPRATGTEVVHHRGHMFLLSDLFLVCERMTDEERAMERRREGGEGDEVDMWLLYPPLAGKVLRVAEVEDTVFSVAIMRKETLYIHTESIQARDFMLKEFRECIDFASSIGPVSKHPPPPMPPLPPSISSGSNNFNAPPPPQNQPNLPPRPPRIPTPDHMRPADDSDRESFLPPSFSTSSSRPGSSANSFLGSFNTTSPPGSRTPSIASGYGSFQPGQVLNGPGGAYPGPGGGHPGQGGGGYPGGQGPPPPPPGGGPGYAGSERRFSPMSPPPRSLSSAQDGPLPPPPSLGELGPGSVLPARSASVGPPPGGMGPGMIMRGQSVGAPAPGGYGPQGGMAPPQRAPSAGPGIGPPPRAPSAGPGGMPPHRNPSFGTGHPGGLPNGPAGGPPGGYGRPPGPPYGPGLNGMPPPQQNGYYPGPGGPPSDPSFQGGVRKTPSTRSLGSQYQDQSPYNNNAPPLPPIPGQYNGAGGPSTSSSYASSLHAPQPRTLLPSAQLSAHTTGSTGTPDFLEASPPNSPSNETRALPDGPVTTTIQAQMKCKVFLKQQHAQWKSLGSAKLKLYNQQPTDRKSVV